MTAETGRPPPDGSFQALCAELDRRIFAGESLDELLAYAAEELVGTLELPLVWIGVREEEGEVGHVAVAGPERSYLDDVEIRWDETPRGRGPTGQAIRTGRPATARIAEDPLFEPWRQPALEHGLAASAAVPLREGERPIGAMGLYARRADRFGDEEVARIQHLADHLSLAILRHRDLAALERSERRFRQMAESIEEVFYLHDPEIEELYYLSPAYETIWGRPVEEVHEDPGAWLEAIHPEDRPAVAEALREGRTEGFEVEYRVVRPDGGVRWVRDRGFPVTDEAGETIRIAGVVADITHNKRTERELRRQEERYRALFRDAGDAVVVTDLEGRIREVNEAFVELSGYTRDRLEGAHVASFYVDPDQREELVAALQEEGSVRDAEVRLRRADGEYRHCLITASLVATAAGERRVQATVRDVTAQVHHRAELRHAAQHDPLTGLPNRMLLRDRLDRVLARAERSGEPAALFYVDLNDFKRVNDTLGHEAGDQVLIETARRLSDAVRGADTVARIGGDEFIALLSEVEGRAGAEEAAERVRSALEPEIEAHGTAVSMTAAVGVALVGGTDLPDALPTDEARADPDRLLGRADRAMYAAKEEEGSAVVFYRPGLEPEG